MDLPNAEALATFSEIEVRACFDSWVENEQQNGLVDIKFALSTIGDGMVVDVMRQLLCIQADRAAGKHETFFD